MSGYVGDVSAKQQMRLNKLRNMLDDVRRDDFESDAYLLRWLRARNFDLTKTEKMIRAHLVWRAQNGIDTIRRDYNEPEVLKKYYQGGYCGHSKSGCPLWIDPVGLCDPKGIYKSANRQEIIRNKMWHLEYMERELIPQKAKETNKPVTQSVCIFDLDHLGMKHMWKTGLDLFCDILSMAEANYPEIMHKTFVINAPSFFPVLFQIVKVFLNPETVKKIEIPRGDYRNVLLKHFDPENLPVKYGGARVDDNGDPNCSSYICYGGAVPESYYRKEMSASFEEEVLVLHGCSVKMDYLIENSGSKIRCRYRTVEHDIAFGVFRKSNTDSTNADTQALEVIFPLKRRDAHISLQDEVFTCYLPGVYVVCFDNSYSWRRNKQVIYNITVEYNGAEITNSQGVSEIDTTESTAQP